MTPDEVAQIEQTMPGFSGMTPAQQENIVTKLRLRQAASMVQPKKPTVTDQAIGTLPTVGTVAATNALTGGSAASGAGALTTPTVIGASRVPATVAPTGTWSLGGIGSAGNGFLPGAGALGAYDLISNDRRGARGILQGAASGAAMGSYFGAPGAIVGGAIGTGVGVAKTLEGGKSKDQQGRDKNRKSLQELGLYDKDFNITLSDGTKVNMGGDGSIKNYNVDFNKQGIGDVVALVNPLAFLVANGDQKRANDLAGELTNAIYSSKDPRAEAKRIYESLGVTLSAANEGIDKLGVDDDTKKVFKGTLASLGISDGASQPQQGNSNAGAYAALSKLLRNQPQPQMPKVDTGAQTRSALLRSMLADSTRPIAYPSQGQQPNIPNQNLNSTLNRIIGL